MNISSIKQGLAAVSSFANVNGVAGLSRTDATGSAPSSVGSIGGGDSFRSDFASMLAAVQAGDISGAQSALGTLQSDISGGSAGYSPDSTASGSTSSTSSPQNDLDALFQAVKNGDVASAQTALTQLQSDAQAGVQQDGQQSQGAQHASGHRHHHHHGGGGIEAAVAQAFQSIQSSSGATDGSSTAAADAATDTTDTASGVSA